MLINGFGTLMRHFMLATPVTARVRHVLNGLVGFVDNDGLLPVVTGDGPLGNSHWHNRFVHGHSGYKVGLASGNRRRGIIDLWLPSLAFTTPTK
jgi:hypothetical protein